MEIEQEENRPKSLTLQNLHSVGEPPKKGGGGGRMLHSSTFSHCHWTCPPALDNYKSSQNL